MNKELLKRMIETSSPSGREDKMIKLIVDEHKDIAEDYIYDNQGSVTVVYNKDADFKVNLMAHADEISLIVNGYNSNGTLTVAKNGGIRPYVYNGCKVRIITRTGEKINGVMGVVSKEKLAVNDLFVDIGVSSKEDAQKIVPLGSYIIHDSDFMELANDTFAGRALDDRLGLFVTQQACRRAMELGAKVGIYCTASVGEENTGRGAYSTTSIIKPDVTMIVDVTFSTDYIGSDTPGCIELGKGGVVCLGSIPNRKLNALLEETAKELNEPLQFEVWSGHTSTDGDTVLKANTGEPQFLFSIPLRYMHSPVEIASYKDVESMIEVIAHFLLKISKDYSLKPYEF